MIGRQYEIERSSMMVHRIKYTEISWTSLGTAGRDVEQFNGFFVEPDYVEPFL
jgi:hypothetical protein